MKALRFTVALCVLCALAALAAPAHADTGFLPSAYAGKPNPWPNDVPLPNDQLLAAYTARYNCPIGVQPCRPGYSAELFTLNYTALENACKAGEFGPGHNCQVTTVEASDSSFVNPRGGAFIQTWVVNQMEGGRPDWPHVIHDTTRPCGLFSKPKELFASYTVYYSNEAPCGHEQPLLCPNGKADPGETCVTCPQDIGPCPLCPNGKADPGETCVTCPQDIGPCPLCPNGKADPGETCETCPQDIGPCAKPCKSVSGELVTLREIIAKSMASPTRKRLRLELLPKLEALDLYCPAH
jgi:hypothetical protein